MQSNKFRSMFSGLFVIVALCSQSVVPAYSRLQSPAPLNNDEVYFAMARRNLEQNDSPMTSVVSVLDEVVEVAQIAPGADGKTTVTVKEKLPSSAAYPQKSIKLVFAVAANKWRWESFEDRGKQYPVEKLFPYAKNEIVQKKNAADAAWKKTFDGVDALAASALKALETAKAVLKTEPPVMSAITSARATLAKAKESNEADAIKSAIREVMQSVEPVATLADQHAELKANDAYLRLQDEFLAVQKNLPVARKSYHDALAAYNEVLMRLPYGLVAYGLGFTKTEPIIEVE